MPTIAERVTALEAEMDTLRTRVNGIVTKALEIEDKLRALLSEAGSLRQAQGMVEYRQHNIERRQERKEA